MFSPEGDYEMVVFDVLVHYTRGDEGPFEEPLWFDNILEWLKEHDIKLYGRISATFAGMDTKETTQPQLVAELHKSGVDMNEMAIGRRSNRYCLRAVRSFLLT